MVFILANPWVPGECSYELKQTALKNHTQSVNNAVKHTEGKKKDDNQDGLKLLRSKQYHRSFLKPKWIVYSFIINYLNVCFKFSIQYDYKVQTVFCIQWMKYSLQWYNEMIMSFSFFLSSDLLDHLLQRNPQVLHISTVQHRKQW